jgi:hypothetical protein
MSTDHVKRVVLELEPGEPIHGRITILTGPPQRFHGWLELASKLEHAWPSGGTPNAAPINPQ